MSDSDLGPVLFVGGIFDGQTKMMGWDFDKCAQPVMPETGIIAVHHYRDVAMRSDGVRVFQQFTPEHARGFTCSGCHASIPVEVAFHYNDYEGAPDPWDCPECKRPLLIRDKAEVPA